MIRVPFSSVPVGATRLTMSSAFNALGEMMSSTNAKGLTTQLKYDDDGHEIEEDDPVPSTNGGDDREPTIQPIT